MTTLDERNQTRTGRDDQDVPAHVVRQTEPDAPSSPASGGLPLRFTGMDTLHHSHPSLSPELRALLRELRSRVEGEVRFDSASLSAYSTDASNYRQIPIGVVVPKTLDDLIATVDVCRRHGVPITHRGGGTSLAGQTCNVAVVIDNSKYLDRVEAIDPEARTVWVEPGCNLDHLRQVAGPYGLTYGPDPATHSRNTLGGMIGNNSCGTHSVMSEFYGPGPLTVQQVLELDVLTSSGERFTVGPMTPDEVDAAIERNDAKGRIIRQLRELRDRHLDAIRTGFPHIPRRVSGFNLDQLLDENGFNLARALVGTEGTCVTILRAKLQLMEDRPQRTLVVLGFPDVATAGDHVPMAREHRPVACEGFDHLLIEFMRKKGLHPEEVDLLPDGKGYLLVEFGAAEKQDADEQAQRFVDACRKLDETPSIKVFEKKWEAEKLWQVRESALGAASHVPGLRTTHPGWEDAAVPPDRVGDYLRDFRKLLDEFGYTASVYGHLGQGCVHCRIDFILDTADGVRTWRHFLERAAHLVTDYGGSLSGEHGDGQARAALLGIMYGEELVEAFAEFKDIWDPEGLMNPGKVVRPNQPTDDLREGPQSKLRTVQTYFAFPDDDHDFGNAAARCVGVGQCRNVDTGYMCPSYMATREEHDSTRGRARLLFEMLRGEKFKGWHDKGVKDALDLCLACKSCKSECPVNVDMATYKAEFLAHFYKWRPRPRSDYAITLIYWWARIASHAPGLVNAVAQAPVLSSLIKFGGGVAQQREIPRFAEPAFTTWFRSRVAGEPGEKPTHDGEPVLDPAASGAAQERYMTESMRSLSRLNTLHPQGGDAPLEVDRVILWPDTFNNYLDSPVLRASVEVLEHAGYKVSIPSRPLCCGRPLYDAGMLPLAKRLWRQILDTLREDIRDGVPVIGVEPSCVAAFRDELVNLFPNDGDAKRLAHQTYLLSEFLERQDYQPPRLASGDEDVKALVQFHCHQNAVLGLDAEKALLKRMGVDAEVLDGGCCGLAGSFGFSAGEKYDVSVRVAERKMMPQVRAADESTEILADGFSCHEQIAHLSDRTPRHIAELLRDAVRAESRR